MGSKHRIIRVTGGKSHDISDYGFMGKVLESTQSGISIAGVLAGVKKLHPDVKFFVVVHKAETTRTPAMKASKQIAGDGRARPAGESPRKSAGRPKP